jgi:hypothetical protein
MLLSGHLNPRILRSRIAREPKRFQRSLSSETPHKLISPARHHVFVWNVVWFAGDAIHITYGNR